MGINVPSLKGWCGVSSVGEQKNFQATEVVLLTINNLEEILQ